LFGTMVPGGSAGPASPNWLCSALRTAHFEPHSFSIGFVCTTVYRLPSAAYRFLALFRAFRPPRRHPASPIGFFCIIGSGQGHADAPRHPKAPKFGFVWRSLPSRERRSPDRHNGRNWLCSAELPCGHHPGRPRFGLFAQLSPAPPGELALFGMIGIGLERWNNRIVEWWDIPALWGGSQPVRLALFVQTGTAAHWLCLPNHKSQFTNHRSEGPSRTGASLYLGAVLHESCRNSVRARGPKSA
jgi:hypothetical protein